jgi:hypothetical protein
MSQQQPQRGSTALKKILREPRTAVPDIAHDAPNFTALTPTRQNAIKSATFARIDNPSRSLIHNLSTPRGLSLLACDKSYIEAVNEPNKGKKYVMWIKKITHHQWCKHILNTQDVAFFIRAVLSTVVARVWA